MSLVKRIREKQVGEQAFESVLVRYRSELKEVVKVRPDDVEAIKDLESGIVFVSLFLKNYKEIRDGK